MIESIGLERSRPLLIEHKIQDTFQFTLSFACQIDVNDYETLREWHDAVTAHVVTSPHNRPRSTKIELKLPVYKNQ